MSMSNDIKSNDANLGLTRRKTKRRRGVPFPKTLCQQGDSGGELTVPKPVRTCPNCSCCVDGLCRPGPSSGCPDAVDSRWPYPCPCTSNTMDAPLP